MGFLNISHCALKNKPIVITLDGRIRGNELLLYTVELLSLHYRTKVLTII
jgi:hypothetical protein